MIDKCKPSSVFITLIVHVTVSVFLYSFASTSTFAQTTKESRRALLRIPINDKTQIIKEDGVTKFAVRDYLSSTRAVVKEGTVIDFVSYYPYGEGQGESAQQSDDRLFTGHRKLDGLSVYHAGARFYSPRLGRFIQADSVDGPNRYYYTNNNPIAFNDPTGNCPMCVVFGIAATLMTMPMSSSAPNTTTYGPPAPGTLDHSALTYGPGDAVSSFLMGFSAPLIAGQGGALIGVARTGLTTRSVSLTAGACGSNPNCMEGIQTVGELVTGAEMGPISLGDQVAFRKTTADTTQVARGGRHYVGGGSDEFVALGRLHQAAPDQVAQPIKLVRSADEVIGYDAEFIEGRTIFDIYQENDYSMPAEYRGVLPQIEDFVDRIHSQGLAHGDLNGRNIILQPNGRIRVIDPVGFGHQDTGQLGILREEDLSGLSRLRSLFGVAETSVATSFEPAFGN